MATVTKLKAAVNNKNLPILGDDGKLYNYYVGKWSNALVENGYTPSVSEISAANTFIENGINNGWINKVKYLMPFIGIESAPITGMVPLIDNIAQYNLIEQTVNAKLFSYNYGKIACLGGRTDNINIYAKLPINTSQLGTPNCFSPIICAVIDEKVQEGDFTRGIITYAADINDRSRYQVRKNSISDYFEFGVRVNPSQDTNFVPIKGSDITIPGNASIFMARYHNDITNRNEFKRYIMIDKKSSPISADMRGDIGVEMPTDGPYEIFLGHPNDSSTPMSVKVNLVAYMDVTTLTANDMLKFNQAMFAFMKAIGR